MKKTKSSYIEKDIVSEISKIYDGKIECNDRAVLSEGNEIDIYLPEIHMGIEVNGDLWHSDAAIQYKYCMTGEAYHQGKILEAKKNGVTLLIVWEYDWYTNHDNALKALSEAILARKGVPLLMKHISPRNDDFTEDDIFDFEDLLDEGLLNERLILSSALNGLSEKEKCFMSKVITKQLKNSFFINFDVNQISDILQWSVEDVVGTVKNLLNRGVLVRYSDVRVIVNPKYITNRYRAERLGTNTL